MAHLEQMVPAPVTAIRDMSANDANGIMTVNCMAQNENLKFYKDAKYWNADLQKEFLHETSGLWTDTHADKYTGRIFNTRGPNDQELELTMNKVDNELDAAIQRFGKVNLPTNMHIDDFYEKIDNNKQDIARA